MRALSLTCLALALLGLTGLGSTAFAKPKIAVLGLEVLNPSGQALDPNTPVVAKELTDALRARARQGSGNYDLAGNSEKELVDEKLINACDTELPSCMAPIGGGIGAAYLLYGHIKKEGGNYVVDLQLLNVNTRSKEKNKNRIELPLGDAGDPAKLQAFAKKWYAFLTNESTTGRVVVTVSNKDAERGSVLLDGKEKGFLSSGRVELDKISPGAHKLAVEVGGFQRFEQEITVVSGDTTPVAVTLELNPGGLSSDFRREKEGTVGEGDKPNYWRPIFVAGSVVALAGTSFWIYAYMKEVGEEGKISGVIDAAPHPGPNGTTIDYRDAGPEDCKAPYNPFRGTGNESSVEALKAACKYRDWTKYGIAGASIGGVIMLGTFYFAWLRDNKGEESATRTGNRNRARKPSFAVTPIVSPDTGGATLRIDW